MSTDLDTQGRPRRTAAAAVASLVIVVVVVVIVAAFGIRRPPELPSLAEDPDETVPGTVALLQHTARGETCVDLVPAGGGEVTRLTCAEPVGGWIESLTWTPSGEVVLVRHGEPRIGGRQTMTAAIVSVPDGEVIDEVELPGDWARPAGGPGQRSEGTVVLAASSHRDGEARLIVRSPQGETTTIADLDGPEGYAFVEPRWSPDGGWILVRDTEQRLIIVAEDGEPGPRVLVDLGGRSGGYVADVAWYVPGERTHTLDPAEVAGTPGTRSETAGDD